LIDFKDHPGRLDYYFVGKGNTAEKQKSVQEKEEKKDPFHKLMLLYYWNLNFLSPHH